jgi:hypothetical protein
MEAIDRLAAVLSLPVATVKAMTLEEVDRRLGRESLGLPDLAGRFALPVTAVKAMKLGEIEGRLRLEGPRPQGGEAAGRSVVRKGLAPGPGPGPNPPPAPRGARGTPAPPEDLDREAARSVEALVPAIRAAIGGYIRSRLGIR